MFSHVTLEFTFILTSVLEGHITIGLINLIIWGYLRFPGFSNHCKCM